MPQRLDYLGRLKRNVTGKTTSVCVESCSNSDLRQWAAHANCIDYFFCFVFFFLIKRLLFRETADQNDDELGYCLLLQQIRDTIDDDHSIQFNINRLKILDGAVRAIKRKTFCDHPMGRLDIKFSDSFGFPESAIDAGGPTREFLKLLTSAVMRSPVFEGPANARILTRNETGELN